MPASTTEPALPPESRLRELARILAAGLLRLNTDAVEASHPPPETLQKSAPNELAVCGQKSVTVHAG